MMYRVQFVVEGTIWVEGPSEELVRAWCEDNTAAMVGRWEGFQDLTIKEDPACLSADIRLDAIGVEED